MGDLNIRKIPDSLYDQFKKKANEREISIPKLLIELIGEEFDEDGIDRSKSIVTICISKVPLKLKKEFMAACTSEKIDIQDAIIKLMEDKTNRWRASK